MKHLLLLLTSLGLLLTGCSYLPHSGPSYASIQKLEQNKEQEAIYSKVRIIDLNQLPLTISDQQTTLINTPPYVTPLLVSSKTTQHIDTIGKGDRLQIAIMETPPAILFSRAATDGDAPKTGLVQLPTVQVDSKGMISLPFIGVLQASNKTPIQLQNDITAKLSSIANQPQVVVSIIDNLSANITIIGDGFSSKMPLSAKGERLLDAIALMGNSMYNIKDTLVRVTRNEEVNELPLSLILSHPNYNITLQKGDVISLINKPSAFIAMGATGSTRELPFEATGISLSQAVARMGGLRENLADARGVFVFRYQADTEIDKLSPAPETQTNTIDISLNEPPIIINKPEPGPQTHIPVVYQVDLTNPNSLFVMKNFAMQDNDIVYVAAAPIIEMQKFLYAIFSPSIGLANQVNTLSN